MKFNHENLYRKSPNAVAQIHGGAEAPLLSGCVRFYQDMLSFVK